MTVTRQTFDQVMIPCYVPQNMVLERGEGCYLYDTEGKRYVDLSAGIAVNCLGHNHPEVVKTISAQAQRLIHVSNIFVNDKTLTLAQELTSLTGFDKVFFTNSGAEANEAALKLARRVAYDNFGAEKDEIISFSHSFHGRTYGAITVTGQEKYHKGFAPMLPGVVYAEYNDLESVKALMNEHTAAIIVEPLQGEGGIIPATEEFLSGLRALCDSHDALLIFDEVQCGMGRTGKPFCFQNYSVKPDIMTLAKALGGGLPMGAAVAFERAAGIFSPGDHAATFGGNVASAALAEVVLAKLSMLSEDVARRGRYLHGKLEDLVAKHPDKAVEARGMGFMQGLDLKIPPKDVISKCMEKGLLVCSAGYTVLRFVPPLIATEDDIDRAISIVDAALSEL